MREEKKAEPFVPPRCPNCGEPITRVRETIYETYWFDAETGTYREEYGTSMDITCPMCDTDLGDVFEDGACNYQAKPQPVSTESKEEGDVRGASPV